MFRFCWHDWNKWGNILQDYTGKRYQFRSCKKCNKIITRKAFWLNTITDSEIEKSI